MYVWSSIFLAVHFIKNILLRFVLYIYFLICTLYSNDLESRQCMDRRRLEDAFFQYALLRVAVWYPSQVCIQQLQLHDGLSKTLLEITPLFHKAFIQEYAGMSK